MRNIILGVLLVAFCLIPLSRLCATDAEANEAFLKATAEAKTGDWDDAADEYIAAELYADSHVLKANALKKAADAYGKADFLYKEFACLKKLVERYPNQIDFKKIINREFQIGNRFFKGYRESPYSWLPWLKDKDRSIEVYETIQKQAPYAKFVPSMMFRLGELYLKNSQNEKAVEIYRKIIKEYPNSDHAALAYLDLANIELQLARSGDGDGSHAHAARDYLQAFIKKYPDSPELPWAKKSFKKATELAAGRLYHLAEYYYENGNSLAAKRYLKNVIIDYPKSDFTPSAEKLLERMGAEPVSVKSDPGKKTEKTAKSQKSEFSVSPMEGEKREVMIIPENSGKKWLLPVRDLGLDEKTESI